MIVTCPLLCKISIGNGPAIIPGIPSGRHRTTRSAMGWPLALASRAACACACHSFRYCAFRGGCGGFGIEGSLARSHEPVMSGIFTDGCCADRTEAVQTMRMMSSPNVLNNCLIVFAYIVTLLLYHSGSGVRLNVFAAGTGSSRFSPLAKMI